MLVVMDAGNSNTVIGAYDGDTLRAHWRIGTNGQRTLDELRALLAMLFHQEGLSFDDVRGCCIASVVPQLNHDFLQLSSEAFHVEPVMVGPGTKTGLVLQCENPKEVGADRIVNAVGALERHPGPLIVIDFGTATTFDVITAKGEYRGGVIVPGIEVASSALFERCAKLPRVDISRPASVIGRNTVDNIRSGLTYGYADMVDGLVGRMRDEMGVDAYVMATGGLATLIADIAKRIDEVDPWLTLKGLKAIYRKNERGTT